MILSGSMGAVRIARAIHNAVCAFILSSSSGATPPSARVVVRTILESIYASCHRRCTFNIPTIVGIGLAVVTWPNREPARRFIFNLRPPCRAFPSHTVYVFYPKR